MNNKYESALWHVQDALLQDDTDDIFEHLSAADTDLKEISEPDGGARNAQRCCSLCLEVANDDYLPETRNMFLSQLEKILKELING